MGGSASKQPHRPMKISHGDDSDEEISSLQGELSQLNPEPDNDFLAKISPESSTTIDSTTVDSMVSSTTESITEFITTKNSTFDSSNATVDSIISSTTDSIGKFLPTQNSRIEHNNKQNSAIDSSNSTIDSIVSSTTESIGEFFTTPISTNDSSFVNESLNSTAGFFTTSNPISTDSSNYPINITSMPEFLLSNSTQGLYNPNNPNPDSSTEFGYFGLGKAEASWIIPLGLILSVFVLWIVVHVIGAAYYSFVGLRRSGSYEVASKSRVVNHDVIIIDSGDDDEKDEKTRFLGWRFK